MRTYYDARPKRIRAVKLGDNNSVYFDRNHLRKQHAGLDEDIHMLMFEKVVEPFTSRLGLAGHDEQVSLSFDQWTTRN